MKKMIKLFAAFAMISLAISFASCDLASEDELLDAATEATVGNGNSNSTPGTDNAVGGVGSGNDSADNGDNNSGSGGTGGSGGGSNTPVEEVTDTIGDSWGTLFANTNHNPVDLQVWQGFDASYDDPELGMYCEILPGAWFGGAIVQNCSAAPADSVYYNMSSVAKVTFKVKASMDMDIWVGYSNKAKSDSFVKQNIEATTEWQTITINQKGVKQAWSIFAFGSDGVGDDAWIAFKDVTYLDANGKSVALKYIQ